MPISVSAPPNSLFNSVVQIADSADVTINENDHDRTLFEMGDDSILRLAVGGWITPGRHFGIIAKDGSTTFADVIATAGVTIDTVDGGQVRNPYPGTGITLFVVTDANVLVKSGSGPTVSI